MWACFIIFQRVFSVTLNLHPSTMQTAVADAFGHWEPPRDMQNYSFSLLCLPFFLHLFSVHTQFRSLFPSTHTRCAQHRPAFQPPHSLFYLFFTVGDIALDTPKIAHKFVFCRLFLSTTFLIFSCWCHLLLAFCVFPSKRGSTEHPIKSAHTSHSEKCISTNT